MPMCLADLTEIYLGFVDVVAEDQDAARRSHIPEAFVDSVDAAQEGRLATARGSDQRGDDALLDLEIDVVQRLEGAVPEVQLLGLDGECLGGRPVIQNGPPHMPECVRRSPCG